MTRVPLFLHCDLEGTFWSSGRPFATASKFLAWLQSRDVAWNFVTNTVSRSPLQLSREWARFGFDVPVEKFITPIDSLNFLLQKEFPASDGPRGDFWYLGSRSQLARLCRQPTPSVPPSWIILGDSGGFAWSRALFNKIVQALSQNSRLAVLSPSLFYERRQKIFLDTGSILRLFEPFLRQEPTILGKPDLSLLEASRQRVVIPGLVWREIVLGDDVTTDIRMANACGLDSMLVRTGKYRDSDEQREAPTWCVDDLNEAISVFEQVLASESFSNSLQ